jgi:hypothetical protein
MARSRSGIPGLFYFAVILFVAMLIVSGGLFGQLVASFDLAAAQAVASVETDISNSLAREVVSQNGELIEKTVTHGPKHNLSAAASKHTDGYNKVIDCLSKGGAMQVWFNPETGRRANVCQVGPELFGLQILSKFGTDAQGHDIWAEITAFLKENMTRIGQVEKYLENGGYVKIIK